MSILSFLLGEKKKTASAAKERLQIILAHERSGRNPGQADWLPALQRELLAVINLAQQDAELQVENGAQLQKLPLPY